jgi:hypothetical protein
MFVDLIVIVSSLSRSRSVFRFVSMINVLERLDLVRRATELFVLVMEHVVQALVIVNRNGILIIGRW